MATQGARWPRNELRDIPGLTSQHRWRRRPLNQPRRPWTYPRQGPLEDPGNWKIRSDQWRKESLVVKFLEASSAQKVSDFSLMPWMQKRGEKQQFRRGIHNTSDLLGKLLGESDKRVDERGSKERLTFEALLRCVRDLTVAFFRTQLFPRRKQGTACSFVVKCFFQKKVLSTLRRSNFHSRRRIRFTPRKELGSLFEQPRPTTLSETDPPGDSI